MRIQGKNTALSLGLEVHAGNSPTDDGYVNNNTVVSVGIGRNTTAKIVQGLKH